MAADSNDDDPMNPTAALIDNHRWLWIVIYSRLGDAAATEDVLQEVSVAAVRRRNDFAESEHAKSWLYQVALRQTMLLRRKEHRHRAKIRGYGQCLPASDPQTYLGWLCSDEEAGQLHQALQQLKPTDRQVLVLKYCEDYSCPQIAHLLGVKETTIQTRLLRARRRLRGLLIEKYKFED
ncbi:MAG: sigma-70 family RNA polymerase sigma factor [Pirellulales bacterium]|nr:sigma-70 family RNA polymerase sigma factor [Pirellulales bacterium]